MSVLAIDLGTTNVKAAVVRRDGQLLGTGCGSITTTLTADGGAEQDAEQVWHAVLRAAEDALASAGDREGVDGIACASQYSSVVPVDTAGRPTSNMVTWMDQRGAPARLAELGGGRRMKPNPYRSLRWIQIHAIPPLDSGADSLAHMRWLKLARPDAYEQAATFLEPMDFVTMRFSGKAVTNRCSGFMMLLTDTRTSDVAYHPSLLRWSGVDDDKLPPLVPVDRPVGRVLPDVARHLGLSEATVVLPGVNDTQAGAVGAFAFAGDHAGISIGTTGVCIAHADAKKTDVRNSLATMPAPFPDKYIVIAEAGTSGKAVEHFLEQLVFAADSFGDHDPGAGYTALERALERTSPGSDGLLFLPWLTGSQAPAEDRRVRGGFLNLSLQTTREHMARAVLEGVAFNLRWVLSRVERFTKRRFTHVVLGGGGARSPGWSQVLADVLKIPVHQVDDPVFAACRGTALLGFHHLGELDLDEIEQSVPIAAVHDPRPDLAPRYDAMYAQFVRVFRKNRGVFRALNDRSHR